ncbi:MAG: acyl-CoA thioesterase [Chitinophagaceae bacterium]|uniref:Acyl-CoA thioesterase n=1 Tax=Rurimicrobium arvi TaxID=2049916 RepID=A0ABP8MHH7_9BACT
MSETKFARETANVMTELVLPNDTNTLGNLMGGRLMHWMDIAAAIAAMRLCNKPVVTASVDNVSFARPIKLGNILSIETKVTRSFNSSMEVYLKVSGEDLQEKTKYVSNEAYLTFVALNPDGKPTKVPEVIPETEEEKERYNGALRRRQLRLILGGKMKVDEAVELRALFIKD